MELLQLKYFCDAAKTENFSKTAKKFNVPPSDISQSIKRLENELETALFMRQANRIFLNECGADFYKKIAEALLIIENAKKAVSDKQNSGSITICANTNRRIIMETVGKFKALYPNVDIKTTFSLDPDGVDFDIIITSENEELKGYKKKHLLSEGLAIALNGNHPLAKDNVLEISKLATESFVSTNEKSSLYQLTKSICLDFGFEPHIAIQSDDPYYIRRCVELGLAVALVPLFSWRGQFSESVILRPIENYSRVSYVYTPSKKHLPLCAQSFLRILFEECNQTKTAVF